MDLRTLSFFEQFRATREDLGALSHNGSTIGNLIIEGYLTLMKNMKGLFNKILSVEPPPLRNILARAPEIL